MASVTVEPFIRSLAWQYNVQAVAMDPWQAYQMAQRLRAIGIPVILVPQTKTAHGRAVCDTGLWTLARNGQLVLYDHAELTRATAYASAEELPNSMIYVKKRGRRKIDLLVTTSNALAAGTVAPVQVEIIDYAAVGALGPDY